MIMIMINNDNDNDDENDNDNGNNNYHASLRVFLFAWHLCAVLNFLEEFSHYIFALKHYSKERMIIA